MMKNKTKETFNKYTIFLIYAMIPYTFINAVNDTGTASILNRLILAGLLLFAIIPLNNRITEDSIQAHFVILAIYMTVSLIVSGLYRNYTSDAFLREALYTILPIGLFIRVSKEDMPNYKFYRLLIGLISIIVIVGLPVYFKRLPLLIMGREFRILRLNSIGVGFGSFIGVIGMGYLSQLGFSICLYNKTKLGKINILFEIIFAIISFLTLQRSPVIGILIAVVLYVFNGHGLKKGLKYIFLISLSGVAVYIVLFRVVGQFTDFKLENYLNNTIKTMSLGIGERSNQHVIYNSNIVEYVFGKGLGTFSPNNPNAIQSLTDAGMYRVFNELGLVGMILYFFPLLQILMKMVKKKNVFGVYFISFSLASFYVNRTIWSIPSVFVFYLILGIEYKGLRIDRRINNIQDF